MPTLARRTAPKRPLKPHEIDAGLLPQTWRLTVYANPALPEDVVDRDA